MIPIHDRPAQLSLLTRVFLANASVLAPLLAERLVTCGVPSVPGPMLRPMPAERRKQFAVSKLCGLLASAVADACRRERLPCVLGGDHSCAGGTWTGVARTLHEKGSGPLGLLWIDAHMDSHTPGTSHTGRLHGMPLAWLLYAGILWLWHLPVAYDAALADRALHDLEHAAFFLGAVLFWWPVIHPAPRFRCASRHSSRIVYLVLAAFQTAALGLLLTVAPVVLYRTYATANGLGALDDQAWGGVVMWGLGGLIDMIAVLVLLYRSFGAGSARLPAPHPAGVSRSVPTS